MKKQSKTVKVFHYSELIREIVYFVVNKQGDNVYVFHDEKTNIIGEYHAGPGDYLEFLDKKL